MTGRLTAMLVLAPSLWGWAAPDTTPPEKRKLTVGDVLEPNSRLSGVILPRYDRQFRLTSELRANSVTLVGKDLLEVDAIHITLYHPDPRSARGTMDRGTIDLSGVRYWQAEGKIRATGAATLQFENMLTKATGMVLTLDPAEGFLTGAVASRLTLPEKTDSTVMNSHPSKRSLGLLGAALLTHPVVGAPTGREAASRPEPPPPAVATPAADPADPARDASVRANLREVLAASAEATKAAADYLDREKLLEDRAATDPPAAPPERPNITRGEKDALVTCDGGAYFDAAGGKLVYMKAVRVVHPDFTMTGADQLQVHFEKKDPEKEAGKESKEPAKESKEPAKESKEPAKDVAETRPDGASQMVGGLGESVGKVRRIVATGAVHIKQHAAPGKEPVEAFGAVFSHDVETGETTLSGGRPWVSAGKDAILMAKLPGQTLTIQKNGDARFSLGGNDTLLREGILNRDKDKNKKKDEKKKDP